MTFALRYLREHMRLLLLELLFAAVFGIVFWLYRLPLSAVLYPAVICALLGSIFLFNSMYKAYKKHKLLTRLADLRGDVLKNELPIPAAAEESVYQSVIQKLCMEMQSMKEQHTETSQEMIDYFTIWVHQIKTPIASMRLNLEAEDTRLSQRLKSDLLHIEHYVEMVLTYLKMGAESTDYVFAPVSLDKIIRENLRKLRGD